MTAQPKTSPAHITHTADIEGEGCLLAKEGDTHAQIISVEAVLSQQHPQAPVPKVHVQTIGMEPETTPGEPGAIERQPGDLNVNTPEGVAHGEPDLTPGEDINPNPNAPMHLEGMGPEILMDTAEDWPEVFWRRRESPGRMQALKGTGILSSCKSLGLATLPCRRKPDHSPCHHYHHPPPQRLLVCSAHRPSTQGCQQSQNVKVQGP